MKYIFSDVTILLTINRKSIIILFNTLVTKALRCTRNLALEHIKNFLIFSCSDISLIFSEPVVKSLRKVSEVSILLNK